MAERNMKQQFNKEMNNAYVKIFQDKITMDEEREKQAQEVLKAKSREVQQHIMQQIEEKKGKAKGMSHEEFELNKDLLKEIITKKKDLK